MKKQRTNEEIFAKEVMLIDENGKPLGKVSFDQAMLLAYDRELDLVEVGVNPSENMTICKFMDYGKEIYREKKLLSKQRAKQKNPELKEIKLSLRIEKHDLETKIKRANEFFEDGDKVRIFIKLMGREMIFKDKAEKMIDDFKTMCEAQYEQPFKRLGNVISAILYKKKQGKK